MTPRVKRTKTVLVDLSEEQKARLKEARALRDKAKKIEEELVAEGRALQMFKPLVKLMQYDDDFSVEIMTGGPPRFKATFQVIEKVERDEERPEDPIAKMLQKEKAQPKWIEPRTFNALINGPLLSKAEKRKMIAAYFPAIELETEEEASGEEAPPFPLEVGLRYVWDPHSRHPHQIEISRLDGNDVFVRTVHGTMLGEAEAKIPKTELFEHCIPVRGEIS